MKNTKKRGFTIVELVIVIAVIAILAAVLIPTFKNVIDNANKSKALQEARNAWTEFLAEQGKDINTEAKLCIKSGNYYFHVENGQIKECATETTHTSTDHQVPTGTDANKYDVYTVTGGKLVAGTVS